MELGRFFWWTLYLATDMSRVEACLNGMFQETLYTEIPPPHQDDTELRVGPDSDLVAIRPEPDNWVF